jgi:hypothetical protein
MTDQGNVETTEATGSCFDEMAELGRDSILILPANAEALSSEAPIFASTLPTVVKLAKQEGLPFAIWPVVENPRLLEQRSVEWFAPALFVSSLLYTTNPHAVSVALSIVANYLTMLFGGTSAAVVRLNVYVRNDKKGSTAKISYKGPVAGMKHLDDAIRAAAAVATRKDDDASG